MKRDEFRSLLAEYLRTSGRLAGQWSYDDNDDLFEIGLLESFDLPNLVDFLQGVSQSPLDLGAHRIEVFATVDSMYQAFVKE